MLLVLAVTFIAEKMIKEPVILREKQEDTGDDRDLKPAGDAITAGQLKKGNPQVGMANKEPIQRVENSCSGQKCRGYSQKLFHICSLLLLGIFHKSAYHSIQYLYKKL
ncbi:hypothetical protein HMPREF5505_1625 [Lactobacillus delbrueckii subsp. lactis DSM 20072]|nr:hypothetical protein HMPREF5505_1625 [Lactobacillus delbrueckii subsp. lactis DSM 20072]